MFAAGFICGAVVLVIGLLAAGYHFARKAVTGR
jgi:hypothetical protein